MKFLTKLLSEETIKELNEKLGEDLVNQINQKVGDYSIDVGKEKLIPKAVFDDEKKHLKEQLAERDNQLKELGEKAKGNADFELQIKNLQDANKKAQEDYDAKLKETREAYGFKDALAEFKPKNITALSALIDKTKLTYAEDGKVIAGLSEQVEALKKSDAYLFDIAQPKPGTGNPQNGGLDIHPSDDLTAAKETISNIFNS